MTRQIFANQGDVFAACPQGKQEKVDAEWRKSDRQGDIESYEHSFLICVAVDFNFNIFSQLVHIYIAL